MLTLDAATQKESVLGEAPIEEDGSFYIAVPPDKPVRFEVLDAAGRVVRAQRSWIWARSGEEHGCVGATKITPWLRKIAGRWRYADLTRPRGWTWQSHPVSVRIEVAMKILSPTICSRGNRRQPGVGKPPGARPEPGAENPPPSSLVTYEDVTEKAGIHFKHSFGEQKLSSIMEATGSGCAWIDYNNDGLLDLYVVSGRYH